MPRVHDEFGYLLQADTFAAGRLTNPTHPLWPYFETFHIFQRPTYQAKYPPGQGVALAIGRLVAGREIVGVWLSLAAAAAVLCWVFRGVSSWHRAAIMAVAVTIQISVFREWGQTYWGGGVALIGGALLWGGVLRLRRRSRAVDGWAIGIGLLLLSQTRQGEGAAAGLFALIPIITWSHERWRKDPHRVTATLVLPISLCVMAVAGWTLWYNATLGGDPFKLAYLNWEQADSPIAAVRNFTGSGNHTFGYKLGRLTSFLVGPWLGLLVVGNLVRRPSATVIVGTIGAVILATPSLIWSRGWPHYFAPMAPLVWVVLLSGWDGLAGRKRLPWRFAGYAVVTVHLLNCAQALAAPRGPPLRGDWATERQILADELLDKPGRDLVIVSYRPDYNANGEWVFNAADIDAAPVIWARDLGPAANAPLIQYYQDRRIWTVEAQGDLPVLRQWEPPGGRDHE